MCLNSGVQKAQFADIDKFVEQGIMPQKIVKTVKYVLKKRVEEERRGCPFAQSRVPLLERENVHNEEDQLPTAFECSCATNVTDTTEEQPPEVGSDLQTTKKQCGCARAKSQESNPNSNAKRDTLGNKNENGYVDALAVGTQLTRHLAQRLGRELAKFQNSKVYTVFTRTTQPAHVIAICILSFVLLTVWPDLIDSTGGEASAKLGTADAARKSHTLAVIAYLGAFATHFGAQIWMTFVSGLSLYFSLPRHTFGQCQQILFPKYFALNAVLSISMLILFVKYFVPAGWNTNVCVQLLALALTAVIEVTVRLYLAPPMLRLMHEKYKIEDAIGSGQEVGNLVQGDLVQCPHYQRIHKAFRRIHMTIAIGNIVCLLATCLHLYFLASKIHIN